VDGSDTATTALAAIVHNVVSSQDARPCLLDDKPRTRWMNSLELERRMQQEIVS
jgi:hypothetical protein